MSSKEYHSNYYKKNREHLLEKARLYRLHNPDKARECVRTSLAKTKDKRSKDMKRAHTDNPAKRMYNSAKVRAKKYGYEFTITVDDIVVPTHCPILGIKLETGNGRALAKSPTLDRIDNSRGYTPDNVQVISYRANTMKNCASTEDLLKFAYWCTTTMGYGASIWQRTSI